MENKTPQQPGEMKAPEPMTPEKQAEMAKKVKGMLEKMKKNADAFKKSAVQKYGKNIVGILLLPPKAKDAGLELLTILDVKGNLRDQLKKRDVIQKDLAEIAKKTMKTVPVNSILMDDVWEACYKGRYDILGLISVGMTVYDKGWLGSLKAAELHKRMVLQKFEKYVVSYVLGGSLVRGEAHDESDVDTFVVIDNTDVSRMTSAELKNKLTSIIWGMAGQASMDAGVKNKLNIQVYVLTDMWDSIRSANPVIFTFLREGVPLYDRGMFMPWKLLLKQGKITPSPEAIDSYMDYGKHYIKRAKAKLREIAMEDFFWSTATPTQGALMLYGVPPPVPVKLAASVRENFVKNGLMEEKYAKIIEDMIKLRKALEHGDSKIDVTAKLVEEYMKKSEVYLKRLNKLFQQIEKNQIKKQAGDLYEKATEDVHAALLMVGVSKSKDLLKDFKTHLVKKKLAPSKYLEVLDKIFEYKKTLKTGRKELASLQFEQERFAKDIFELIRAEKGKKVEKYKVSATYGDKKADIWMLSDSAFIVMDTADAKTAIKKFSINKAGALEKPVKSDLKVVDAALKKFAGTPTKITKATIDSLKKILGKDINLVIGA